MAEKLIKATHQGKIEIGNTIIPCAVLENGTRILRERSVAKSLGKKGSGGYWQKKKKEEKGSLLPEYVSAKNLEPFIDEETRDVLMTPITYKTKTGGVAQGLPATILPTICDIWLKAREKGALSKIQLTTAKRAEILMRGFAQLGIIALVDEATGYQEIRDRKALQEILDKYLLKEYAKWAKRFPDEFYQHMFRLRKWEWKGMKVNRPSVVGRYTNDLVYDRLAPGILDELKRINPKDAKGKRKALHQQYLTEEIGHPALQIHLNILIAFMRAAPNWDAFHRNVVRAFPKINEDKPLPFDDI